MQINVECFCGTRTEWTRRRTYSSSLQQFIKFQNLAIFMVDVLAYALCARLLMIYYRQTAMKLREIRHVSLKLSLKHFTHLHNVTTQLQNDYGFILKAKVLYVLINLISTTYDTMTYGVSKDYFLMFWMVFVTTDLCIRFWLICYSGDCIRNAVRKMSLNILDFSKRSNITKHCVIDPRL